MAKRCLALVLMMAFVPFAALAGAPAAGKKAVLKLDIKPPEVQVYVDDKPVGAASKAHSVSLAPGRHTVKLVKKGMSHEEQISLKSGETKTWAFNFGGSEGKDEPLKIDEPTKSDVGSDEAGSDP